MQALAVSTVVLDDDTRAANDLAGVTLLVDLAETSPGTEDLGVTDLDQVDLVLGTEGFDEAEVLCLGTGLDEDAKVSLTFVKRLGALAEPTSQAIVDERSLQNLLYANIVSEPHRHSMSGDTYLKSILDRQLSLWCLGNLGLNLNLTGVNVISSVRHPEDAINDTIVSAYSTAYFFKCCD